VERLSIADALARAKQVSHVAAQFDARVASAAARASGARAIANPTASLGGHFGQNAGGTDEDVIVSQTIELGDKRRQRARAASAEQQAAAFDLAGAQNDLTYTVKAAYFEALRSDAGQQLARTALDNAAKVAQSAELQFTAGDVPRTQVTRSRIEQTRAAQALIAAETDRANRYATLRSLTGMPDTTPLELTDKLAFTPISPEPSTLKAYALAHRPDLQSAARLRAGREAQLHESRAQSQPDFFVEGRHATIDPTVGGSTLRFGILFPLLDYGKNRAEIAGAKAALREQDALEAETRRLAVLDVDIALRNYEQARRAVESFVRGRLSSSQELLDLAQLGYTSGATSLLELLDAQQLFRNEQNDYQRALADYNVAVAAMERAVGGRLP
jgi:cobalt-zinc-cadmium efflux system outer membrane protein